MRKYKNIPVEVDGIKFDSKKEAKRYGELKLLERAGEIYELETQPRFVFDHGGIRICSYRADFSYFDTYTNKQIVEDVKSAITAKNPVYRIKNKMMLAFYGIKIVEV